MQGSWLMVRLGGIAAISAMFACSHILFSDPLEYEVSQQGELGGSKVHEVDRCYADDVESLASRIDLHVAPEDPAVRQGKTLLSFVHMSDVQIRDQGVHFKRGFVEKASDWVASGTVRIDELDRNDEMPLLALIEAINSTVGLEESGYQPPRFVIHTGDAIDAGTNGELLQFIHVMNKLQIPWYNVIGNHDVHYFGNFTQHNLTPSAFVSGLGIVRSKSEFIGYHSPENGRSHAPTERARDGLPASRNHGFDLTADGRHGPDGNYAFRLSSPPLRFVVLETVAEDGEIEWKDTQRAGPGAYAGDIDEDQFAWLGSQIEEADASGESVLVFGHHPLKARFDGPLSDPADKDIEYDNHHGRLLDFLLQKKNVIGYFGGHTHKEYRASYHRSGGGPDLLEVIAPSVHEHSQTALLVSLRESTDGNHLDLSVRDISAEPKPTAAIYADWKTAHEANCREKGVGCQGHEVELQSGVYATGGSSHPAPPSMSCTPDNGRTIADVVTEIEGKARDPNSIFEVTDSVRIIAQGAVVSSASRLDRRPLSEVQQHMSAYIQGREGFLKLQRIVLPPFTSGIRGLSFDREGKEEVPWVFEEVSPGKYQLAPGTQDASGAREWRLRRSAQGNTIFVVAEFPGSHLRQGWLDIWIEVADLGTAVPHPRVTFGGDVLTPRFIAGYAFGMGKTIYFCPLDTPEEIRDPSSEVVSAFDPLMSQPDPSSPDQLHRSWATAQAIWQEARMGGSWNGWILPRVANDILLIVSAKRRTPDRTSVGGSP